MKLNNKEICCQIQSSTLENFKLFVDLEITRVETLIFRLLDIGSEENDLLTSKILNCIQELLDTFNRILDIHRNNIIRGEIDEEWKVMFLGEKIPLFTAQIRQINHLNEQHYSTNIIKSQLKECLIFIIRMRMEYKLHLVPEQALE